jgi:hypothetical protein
MVSPSNPFRSSPRWYSPSKYLLLARNLGAGVHDALFPRRSWYSPSRFSRRICETLRSPIHYPTLFKVGVAFVVIYYTAPVVKAHVRGTYRWTKRNAAKVVKRRSWLKRQGGKVKNKVGKWM